MLFIQLFVCGQVIFVSFFRLPCEYFSFSTWVKVTAAMKFVENQQNKYESVWQLVLKFKAFEIGRNSHERICGISFLSSCGIFHGWVRITTCKINKILRNEGKYFSVTAFKTWKSQVILWSVLYWSLVGGGREEKL